MQLVYAQASPFVRKVLVLLEEAGQRSEIELIDGFGSPTQPNKAAVAANPLGKIPCMILDDGARLYDSRVITRYLDNRYGLGVYPQGDTAWVTLTLEAHADAMLDAAVLCVYETRCREEAIRSPEWLAAQRAKIIRGLDALETQWLNHLAGPMDIGHIGVGCVLGYLDFRKSMGGWSDWRDNHPGLVAWADAFMQRPAMKATAPA